MYLRILAASTLALGIASSALADPLTLSVVPKGPRLVTVYTNVQERSQDGIRPDGTINIDQTVVSSSRSPIRIQCDSSPTTSVMRSNTFDAPPSSDCP